MRRSDRNMDPGVRSMGSACASCLKDFMFYRGRSWVALGRAARLSWACEATTHREREEGRMAKRRRTRKAINAVRRSRRRSTLAIRAKACPFSYQDEKYLDVDESLAPTIDIYLIFFGIRRNCRHSTGSEQQVTPPAESALARIRTPQRWRGQAAS